MNGHLTTSQLKDLKATLLELRMGLLNRLQLLREELASVESIGSEEGDLSLGQVTEHNIYIHNQRVRQLILEVDAALARMERGTYGICEETGESIELARLQLLPYTRFSTEGAEIRDTKQNMIS